MKLSYNILWLDDKISAFIDDGWVDKIKDHLIDEGFEPNIHTTAKVDVFFSCLDESFDLILTDYHMDEKNGDEVVKEIRRTRNIQTEILFYTAKEDLQTIDKMDRVTYVETSGDHYSAVVDEIVELINLTIKKFQHIITMRGMIMHETSALDSQTAQILHMYLKSGKASNDKIINSICMDLEKLLTRKQEIVKNIKETINYNKLIKDTFLFSAKYKIEALKDIIDKLSIVDFTDDYKEEVANLRNIFAHVVLKTDDNGRQYFESGEDGITFDESICRKLRKDINKHKNNIDELDKALKLFVAD